MAETETQQRDPFWAVVEVMGHSRHIGIVSEVTLAGAAMLQVETPALPADVVAETERRQDATNAEVVLLSPSALFRVTPTSEPRCVAMLAAARPWIYPEVRRPALSAPVDSTTCRGVHEDPNNSGKCIRCGLVLDWVAFAADFAADSEDEDF